jgi:hypothetical protein
MPQTAIKAKGRIGMREDNGATRDVARTYREALRREGRHISGLQGLRTLFLSIAKKIASCVI